ncbi:MAG: magnesium chelatase [Phycisphaerales bacterium]
MTTLPSTLNELRDSGWISKTVKDELAANMIAALQRGDDLFPGILGYEHTVVPEIVNAVLAGHDMLFMGEKGQAKSKMMRSLVRFLDESLPYLDIPGCPVHEDPFNPITTQAKDFLSQHGDRAPIAWWAREDRYAERLAPGTKFADIIGEIDPAKILGMGGTNQAQNDGQTLGQGVSLGSEDALHFGLIPRMHRGLFAMNELPDLDDLVQVGLFNILEERDVQIRGYPVSFEIDVMVLFSANPQTYNRSGKVIPQLKDRIGATIQTHYPRTREAAIEITEQEAFNDGLDLGDPSKPETFPVVVPLFMKQIVEEISLHARKSRFVDQDSGVSARLSIANYKQMVASARQRCIRQGEPHAVPRISDLAHFHASSLGKLELDMMGTHQMSEKQVLDAILAEAITSVFAEYVDQHGFDEIADIFSKGVRIEVGDTLPSIHYQSIVKAVPPIWDRAFEVNASDDPAVRASCIEFVLAGLWAAERISRAERYGTVQYEI